MSEWIRSGESMFNMDNICHFIIEAESIQFYDIAGRTTKLNYSSREECIQIFNQLCGLLDVEEDDE